MMKKKVTHHIKDIRSFIEFLKPDPFIFIQPHNFPDHDAVASAFGLQALLNHYGVKSHIVYEKEIQRDSLKHVISDLGIQIHHIDTYDMQPHHKIILVDGCKGNANVTDLIGNEVGVIDHHQVKDPEDVEFCHIDPDCGACATLIANYFLELEVEIPKNVATAFMIGINMDTASLTRGVSLNDLKIFYHCFSLCDMDYVTSIVRNDILIEDLKQFKFIINHLEYDRRLAFCYIPNGCSQNLLGILADFVLSLHEIEFVVLCTKNDNRIYFSVRSEEPEWDAADIIRKSLEGIGFGGGHDDMAGGVIQDGSDFGKGDYLKKLKSLLLS